MTDVSVVALARNNEQVSRKEEIGFKEEKHYKGAFSNGRPRAHGVFNARGRTFSSVLKRPRRKEMRP